MRTYRPVCRTSALHGMLDELRVVIFDADNPYESVQVQGTASLADDPDGRLIDELSHKYTGGPYPGFAGPNPRWVTARITADRVFSPWPDT